MLFWLRTRLAQPSPGTSAILRLAITSVVLGFAAITDAHALSVGQMTTNGRINPLGIGGDALSLAWSIESDTRGTVQGAYRVRVGTTEGADDVWDSGRVASDRQTDIALPASRPLRPATRYYWQAKIWDGNGTESAWSAPAWFEIGLPAAEWADAKWIAHPQPAPASNGQSVAAGALPLFRRVITLAKPVKRARLYATAHGVYQFSLNGQKVGDQFLAPGWTDYARRRGPLRPGRPAGRRDLRRTPRAARLGSRRLRRIEMAPRRGRAGRHARPRAAARRAGARDRGRHGALALGAGAGRVRVRPRAKPHRLRAGQAHRQSRPDRPAPFRGGDQPPGERRGRLYTESLRTAKATDTYTFARDETVVYQPTFTQHGFRYVEVTGTTLPPEAGDVAAVVLSSDLRNTGDLRLAHPMIDQLVRNIRWGQRGNFLSIPTDTPARDERLAWTGDFAVFATTASRYQDTRAFLSKWMDDLRDAQRPNGNLPAIVPQPRDYFDVTGVGWSDAFIIVPYTVWRATGDTRILRQNWEAMRRWSRRSARRSSRRTATPTAPSKSVRRPFTRWRSAWT